MSCAAGLVTLLPVSEETGGLVVIPGSHKCHEEVCSRVADESQGDFVIIPAQDCILQSTARLVCAEAGDLILWDSRTVHCNTPALTALNGASGAESVEGEEPDGGWGLIRQVG